MLDRARILTKLEQTERYASELDRVRPPDFHEFQRDAKTRYACERLLHVAIESLLDAAELLLVGLRLGLPDADQGVVQRLVESGSIEASDGELLRNMQAFRNILVHRYGQLDDVRVFANAERASTDFGRLVSALRGALDGKSKPA